MTTSETNAWDAIVVGSGLGGLSAAAYLSAAGRKVLLLERYTTLGGSSHVFARRNRWEFDCGVHYVGQCGPDGIVTSMMRGIGVDDRLTWLPMDESGFDRIIAPSFELATPVGWDNYRQALIDAFPAERRAVSRFHAIMRRIADAHDRTDMHTTGSMARWAARAGWAAPFMLMPYATMLAACRLSPRASLVLSVQCGALASKPTALPTAAMAAFLEDYIGDGSYYPQGGGQMLAAAFATVITAHGGSIRTHSEVAQITLADGHVSGVELTNGERIRSAAVVSDADVIKTYTELIGVEHLPALFRQRVLRWKMSQPLINGFFGVDHDVSQQPNSNYFAIPSWQDTTSRRALNRFGDSVSGGRGFDTGEQWARAMADRQPMFVQSSSRRDPSNPRTSPTGHSTIEVQTITPFDPKLWGVSGYDLTTTDYRNGSDYRKIKEIVLGGMAARMEQAFPGSSSAIVFAELGTPATQTRFVNNTAGAPFGLALRLDQVGPLRPRDTTPIPGLYTVGTSTAWGPGTVGSMISGVYAAGSITGRDLIGDIVAGRTVGDTSRLAPWPNNFNPFTNTRNVSEDNNVASTH